MDCVGERTSGKERAVRSRGWLHIHPLAPLPLLCFGALGAWDVFLCVLPVAVLHELGHIAAIYFTGGKVVSIGIEPFGGEIRTDGKLCSYAGSLLISLSGVFVNFLCALPLYRFALCSFGTGLFNLLPLKGLDGGDALKSLLAQKFSMEITDKICGIIAVFGVLVLGLVIFWGLCFSFFNPTLLLLTGYLILRLI